MIGDRRNRLLIGLTASAVFVFGAAVVWVFAVVSSWSSECPHRRILIGGLDKGISAWPPAAQCYDRAGDLYFHEAQPWAQWVIVALLGCAFVVLVALVAVALRDRRTHSSANQPPDAAKPPGP